MSMSFAPFDRALVRRHFERAASSFAACDVLFRESAAQLIERLDGVRRSFDARLDLGPHPFLPGAAAVDVPENEILPCAQESFDLIASNLALHWVNDVPGVLAQIRAALRPGGLFIAAMIGGGSLQELRACLTEAEIAVCGGLSPRVSPMIDLPTASALLHRAGFSLPVADAERVVLTYPDLTALMRDLRGMGQTNAHCQRLRHPTRRGLFALADALYRERFAAPDERLPATFDIVHLHGWV